MQKINRTILVLCPYPQGVAPSQRFRFEQYLETIRQYGYAIDFRPFLTMAGWRTLYTPGSLAQKVSSIALGFLRRFALFFSAVPKADFVFIHREASPVGPPVIEFIIARLMKKKIIYDFDDAIWLDNTSKENAMAARIKWHSKVRQICRWSHVVSVGNDYLGSFARSYCKRVVINPTTLDTENIHNPAAHQKQKEDSRVTIGWTGSHSTLKYLQLIEQVLISLEKEFPNAIRFVMIADRSPALGLKNITFIPWNKAHEIADLSSLDIGLMPLEDDLWSKGKCGLKALQYMSLGIPTIASSVGVNSEIIDHGSNGYLCQTNESWLVHLRKLICNPELRKEIGEAGRKKVVAHYSTKSNLPVFLSLFE